MNSDFILKTETDEYFPIHLESLRIDSHLDFDLYIKTDGKAILFRSSNLPFTEKTKNTLIENGVGELYISTNNRHSYQKYVENNIKEIIRDNSINEISKCKIIYECATQLVKDVLENPTLGENIKRSQRMVESTAFYILSTESAFHNLLRLMSFDYSTYSHSVNVCTFALALAQRIGIKHECELNAIGTGALLHDIGKTKISEAVLLKRTALTEQELILIKKHPEFGVELVRDTDLIPEDAYYPIIQHHEREDGSGYPYGLTANNIHLYGKITAIADVFDAMTTKRIYRVAVDTFPALMAMYSEKDTFDKKLLEQFTLLLGPNELTGF
jgi:putative nucleotidyltransferase with HDIG domain